MTNKEFNDKYLKQSPNFEPDSSFVFEKKKDIKKLLGTNILYRYISIPGAKKYGIQGINDKKIYMTNPNDFNDPFECVTGFDAKSALLKQILTTYKTTLEPRKRCLIDEYYQWSDNFREKSTVFNTISDNDLLKIYQRYNKGLDLNQFGLNDLISDDDFDLYLISYVINNKSTLDYFVKHNTKTKNDNPFILFSDEIPFKTKLKFLFFKMGYKSYKSDDRFKEFISGLLKDNAMREKQFREDNANYGICCFTPDWDNLLMWAHYGDSHSGICIEYDISNCDDEFYINFFPVEYVPNRISINSDEINDDGSPNQLKMTHKNFRYLLCKSTEWEYEKEWRNIIYIDGDPKNDENRKIKSPIVKAIYFGINCKESDKKYIKEKITDPRIKFYDLRTNIKDYKIEKDIFGIDNIELK